jgi:hypothetical protein
VPLQTAVESRQLLRISHKYHTVFAFPFYLFNSHLFKFQVRTLPQVQTKTSHFTISPTSYSLAIFQSRLHTTSSHQHHKSTTAPMDTIHTGKTDCPALARYHAEAISTYLYASHNHHFVSPDTLQRLLNDILDKHPDAVQEKLGEHFYFALGGALARLGEWNKMTFLQLEHEARVQGLLGSSEEHDMTRWHLMVRLMAEKKRVEEMSIGGKEDECDEKVIVTQNDGVRMRF